ncbi:3-phosphoshikimate 1-carboxyvinyltransferase [Spirochaeta africana]|uniref:3-phosphoshikimate 1-carboxyvinyltransferase n=1 Tax=Spirochaeta africana (strain ATCC 700263 / DSM 8902 / Z-7692) TaxID=889378 RepID=H9UMB1_SPIAZ|nr:3-phosphoshikimate 1-carboxyvinyltransferase [Spirochaeta africana]AFG38654.1 3-phosphoshikimate 1-carboxyvinyltransferase [Spirochaeta africana DSM 8902]
MEKTIIPGKLAGSVRIPGSKSHTIRALLIATLAEGESIIRDPLYSADTRSCIAACRAFGARITEAADHITVTGLGGLPQPPAQPIDVGNSGTTLYLAVGISALVDGTTEFTGDHQIQARPIKPLLDSLADMGARIEYLQNDGYPPFRITGPIRGGYTTIECKTSQYLSSLLLSLPLTPAGSEPSRISVPLLNEKPYVDITLAWLAEQGITPQHDNYDNWVIQPGAHFSAFDKPIAGDFSSATFMLCAAAMTGSKLRLEGLDMTDSQGDKAVVGILEQMGCAVSIEEFAIGIAGPGHPDCPATQLSGGEFDLNAIPDALPALAACAACAAQEVRLVNVPQARLKETDRIAVMARELTTLGVDISERPDGLVIRPAADPAPGSPKFRSGSVHGHGDHRIVMSMAIAGLAADGPVTVDTAETAGITFPDFFSTLAELRLK